MSFYTDCSSEALVDIPADVCPESLGQTVMALIQKRKDGASLNQIDITIANEHLLLATWQGLTAAVDDTKVVKTPEFGAPEMPEVEIRTQGSGNEIPNGIPINLGEGFSSFEAVLYGKKQNIIKALKDLSGDLAVYLVDHFGRIMAVTDDPDAPTYIRPIPILNFVTTSKQLGGYDAVDMNKIGWSFRPDWSDDTFIFEPDFNPVLDL